jgi:hypothetical protein
VSDGHLGGAEERVIKRSMLSQVDHICGDPNCTGEDPTKAGRTG